MLTSLPTLFLGIAIVLGFLGMLFMAKGVRVRNRGVRSCPRCWHLMNKISGLRCPECGHDASSERALLKMNRARGRLLFGLLLVTAAIFLGQNTRTMSAIWWWVPDRVIVMLAPHDASKLNDGPRYELYNRIRSNVLSRPAIEAVMQSAIDGTPSARPGTREWSSVYSQLIPRLLFNLDEDDPLRDRLRELEPIVLLEVPATWPPEDPAIVLLTMDRFPGGLDEVELVLHDVPDGPRTYVHHAENRSRFPLVLTLEPPGSTGIDRSIRCTINSRSEGFEPLERNLLVVIAPAPGLNEALQPRDSEEMTERIYRGVFQYPIVLHETGNPPWSLRFSTGGANTTAFSDVVLGLQVDLRRNGLLVRQSLIWWHGGVMDAGWETIFEDRETLRMANDEDGEWTLRVTGRRDVALRALTGAPRARAYWSGSFERPIEIVLRPGWIAPREWEQIERPDHDRTIAGMSRR